MVAVLCHNIWAACLVAVVAGIVNTLWVRERGAHGRLLIQLGGSWGRGAFLEAVP